jgi:hypothetical protein
LLLSAPARGPTVINSYLHVRRVGTKSRAALLSGQRYAPVVPAVDRRAGEGRMACRLLEDESLLAMHAPYEQFKSNNHAFRVCLSNKQCWETGVLYALYAPYEQANTNHALQLWQKLWKIQACCTHCMHRMYNPSQPIMHWQFGKYRRDVRTFSAAQKSSGRGPGAKLALPHHTHASERASERFPDLMMSYTMSQSL